MKQVQKNKKSKAVYIIGAITLGIIVLLAVYLIVLATGGVSGSATQLVITTSSSTAEYNGMELTCDEWKLSSGALKDGHELSVTVTGSRTDVGTCRNTATAVVHDSNGNNVTDDYSISIDTGVLEVTPRKIILQSASAEKEYDGTPLTSESCDVVGGSLLAGHYITYYVNGTLTGSGRTDNTFKATVSDGVRDVSHNYNLEYLFGTLYVHGEKLEILTHSASKAYDGDALTCNKWTLTSGTLHDGHTLEVTVLGSQTAVGTSDNVASCKVKDSNGADVTNMYEPVFTYGELTVEPIVILVETRPAYKMYDGTPLTCDGWRVVTDSALATDTWYESGESFKADGYNVTATVVGSITDVGEADNSVVFVTVTDKSGGACDGVEVRYKLGTLTVAPRPITVQSGTAGKRFDGTPLTCNEYEVVSITKVAEGQSISVAVTGTITYVGSVINTIAEVRISSDNEDVTRNYNIKLQEGVLTILGDDSSIIIGSNPIGSDGSGDINESGGLADGNYDSNASVALLLRTDCDGEVYLRYMSYGGYTGKGWGSANAYPAAITANDWQGHTTTYGMNYLTGIALSSKLEYNRADIKLVNSSQYFLPYYLSTEALGYTVQSSDVIYTGNGTEYSMFFYSYNYIADGGRKLNNVDLGELSGVEAKYREFVKQNYLAVPKSTLEYINGIIDEQAFRGLSVPEKIAAVARYVRSAATYNLKYDRELDGESDVAVAFLKTYKEGVCRHYATAATLIYRALGLPARYCIGYVETAKSGEWVEIKANKAHAWTEVYIDGAGWVQVEVTGGGAGFDGTGGSGNTGIGNPESTDELFIKPFDIDLSYADYDGTPFTYNLTKLQGLTALSQKGYTYEFTVEGAQSGIGIGESKITAFKLFDYYGQDVTDKFNITLSTGKLHIYVQEITVRTDSVERVYDGTPLYSPEGGWECIGALLKGHTISEVVLTGSQKNVGRSLNTFDIFISDEDGDDVTYMYKVNAECGTLRITVREIVVTAGSAIAYEKDLNGGSLVCGSYSITCLSGDGNSGLGEGDVEAVVLSGSQNGVGKSANKIVSVAILNADGEDVTYNYSIKYESGTLTVLPGSSGTSVAEAKEAGD